MKTITQYKEDIKNLMKKAGDIDAKCVAENREPIASEISLKNEILDTVDELRKIIEVQERQEKMASLLEKPEPAQTLDRNRKSLDDNQSKKDRFNSLGEQMAAVIRAGRPGGQVDPRLYNIRAASGMNEAVPSEGGLA